MRIGTVRRARDRLAKLWPAGPTVTANGATMVMVHHHPIAYQGDMSWYASTYGRHDTRWLVTADHARLRRAAKVLWRPIGVEIAAAHSRGLDLNNNLAISRCWVIDFDQGQAPFAQKNNALQIPLSRDIDVAGGVAIEPFPPGSGR